MKSCLRPRALSVGTLAVAAITLLSAAPAMGASGNSNTHNVGVRASGASHPQLVSPAGTYNMYSANGAAGVLKVKSGHTFSLSGPGTDTGYWVLEDKYFAFVVTAEEDTTDIGCTFLGKLAPGVGINSDSNQGPYDCTGYSNTWYATLVPRGSANKSSEHSSAGRGFSHGSSKVASASAPSGNYELHLSDRAKGALTIDTGGTFSLDYAHGGPTDNGYWVSLGKSYAQVTTSSNSTEDLDCLLLGDVSASTGNIGSASAEGPFVCGDGQTGTWYATKNA
jgi:hypothetical protein